MARRGITIEEVSAAVDKLVSEGKEPTIQAVREALGNTGSPNTIHRHLRALRDAAPQVGREAPELPDDLKLAITQEIERQSAKARSEVEEKLVRALEDAQVLAEEGERNETIQQELEEENQQLTADNQRLSALAEEREKEIETLRAELSEARGKSEENVLALAQARHKLDSLEPISAERDKAVEELAEAQREAAVSASQVEMLRPQLEDSKAELAAARDELRKATAAQAEAVNALALAKQEGAASESKIEGLELRVTELKADLKESRDKVLEAEKQNERLTVELGKKAPRKSQSR